jgi:cation:H+ antiporter
MPWQAQAPEAEPGRPSRRRPHPVAGHPFQGRSTAAVAAIFGAAAAVTLVAGVAIEEAGNELAARIGLSSGVFGGTVLAAATALPEVSTGIQAVRLGDYALAMSDIFGGNAFMPALFVLADLLAGTPALPSARPTDVWLAGLGGVLTVVYGLGILLRPRSRRLRLGLDSRIVVCLYALGVVGLIVVNSATT